MIFSINDYLVPTVEKVLFNNEPVSYSWGNLDALHKWIDNKNKQQIKTALGFAGARKYPLVWLAEGWVAKELLPGVNFTNVSFYIAKNTRVETLSENRVADFSVLYNIATDLISELKKVAFIKENDFNYFERANFGSVAPSNDSSQKQVVTLDVWDCLILNMNIYIVPNSDHCWK